MAIVVTTVAFLIILTLLVLVHELGHYVSARQFGIAVEEFGIGLPPRAMGVKRRKTIFSLNWIPLGGFVKIKGEDGGHTEDNDSFSSKPVWQRGIVLSAGVTMNVLFAMVLLSLGFVLGTPQIIDDKNFDGARLKDQKVIVAHTLDGYPAANAGIETGDAIVSINGNVVASIDSVQDIIEKNGEKPISITVRRKEKEEIKKVTPVLSTREGHSIIGTELVTTAFVSYPIQKAVIRGVTQTFILTKEILTAFWHVLAQAVSGEKISVAISGPVGIAVIAAEVTRLGILYLIQFAALLSINLAIINFIPFPALDGGRFLFLMIEKIRGKAVNQRLENTAHTIGFILLMVLLIIVTFNDINRYQSYFFSLWDTVTSFF